MYYRIVGIIVVLLGIFVGLALFINIQKEGCSDCIPWLTLPLFIIAFGSYLIFRKNRN